MPRPRMKKTANLPEHVYFDPRYGTYRIKLQNGKFKSLGSHRDKAIAIAREYNRLTRPDIAMKVDHLIQHGNFLNEKGFGHYVPDLLKRIIKEEQPSANYTHTMKQDAKRTEEFFEIIAFQEFNHQLAACKRLLE